MIDTDSVLKKSRGDVVNIRMDITIDLPKEVADELEMLGIGEFDGCTFDPSRRQMKAIYSTAYRKGA